MEYTTKNQRSKDKFLHPYYFSDRAMVEPQNKDSHLLGTYKRKYGMEVLELSDRSIRNYSFTSHKTLFTKVSKFNRFRLLISLVAIKL